jgi:hypothetical protein
MTRSSALFTNLLLSLPLATGLLCAAPTAAAQTSSTVTIPFAFTANNHPMAAGTYQVQSGSNPFLGMYNVATHRTRVLMVRPDSGPAISENSHLTFRLSDGKYYLSQVWISGSSTHRELVAHPKVNREVARVIEPVTQTFEIAMK